jgi:hypothetical protein
MEKVMSRLAEVFLDSAYAIALSAPGDEFHTKAEELEEQMEHVVCGTSGVSGRVF